MICSATLFMCTDIPHYTMVVKSFDPIWAVLSIDTTSMWGTHIDKPCVSSVVQNIIC